MVRKCCVKGCKNKQTISNGVSFHRFPNDENLCKRWMEAVGITAVNKWMRICSKHFSEDSMNQMMPGCPYRRLKPDAEPLKLVDLDYNHQSRANSLSAVCKEVTVCGQGRPDSAYSLITCCDRGQLSVSAVNRGTAAVPDQMDTINDMETIMSEVTGETIIRVESTGVHASQKSEHFTDCLVILRSVIGFLHESNLLTNTPLIQQELAKRLPMIDERELSCYTACIWFTARCLTRHSDVTPTSISTAQTADYDNGFWLPIVVEPSLDWSPSTSAVGEMAAGTTCSTVASCTETDDGNSEMADVTKDDAEQRDSTVSTGADGVELTTCTKTERDDDDPTVDRKTPSDLSVCGDNAGIASGTADFPETVVFPAAADAGRSKSDCAETNCDISLDSYSTGDARTPEFNLSSDVPITEAVRTVYVTIERPHVTPFHDDISILTEDYSAEGLRVTGRGRNHITAVLTLPESSSSRNTRVQRIDVMNFNRINYRARSLFTPSSRLHRHKVIHTEANKYRCGACDASYLLPHNLRAHERSHIHVGEKPFKCKICGSFFSRPAFLRKHELEHTGERPFTCS